MSSVATFAAGCFWGVQHAFDQLAGVRDSAVGYMGGAQANPSYEEVCTDRTGHAEVVQVQFDPETVSYDQLLEVFWECHDPTQVNRQGPDVGSQYRSAVFYHDDTQREAALAAIAALDGAGKYSDPVATQVVEAREFWPAEDYHQRYLEKRGVSSCRIDH